LSPAVRKAVVEANVNPAQIQGTGKDGRILKGDVMAFIASGGAKSAPTASRLPTVNDKPGDRRVPMPSIRKRIAERLVFAQHTAAILTTFNEVDMKPVQDVRAKHKDAFEKKYGVKLSFMSFFTRACTLALKELPAVNASIDGTDIVYHDYADIGVAVGTERGLVVPVVRGADKLDFAGIEKGIGELALKARNNKLSIADMSGGTFTISNGGTYGSLLSTPILNPPQSGILGMHKIMDRPVAINGKVEIRPMMYLALSYDHRIIDGKEAVTFLVRVKDLLENPEKLGLDFA
jgi:2-oxoglutarate dehydrogenase E2 component (dihydrolipoamide succinyltransferase)